MLPPNLMVLIFFTSASKNTSLILKGRETNCEVPYLLNNRPILASFLGVSTIDWNKFPVVSKI
jgi:hypothetical protein